MIDKFDFLFFYYSLFSSKKVILTVRSAKILAQHIIRRRVTRRRVGGGNWGDDNASWALSVFRRWTNANQRNNTVGKWCVSALPCSEFRRKNRKQEMRKLSTSLHMISFLTWHLFAYRFRGYDVKATNFIW